MELFDAVHTLAEKMVPDRIEIATTAAGPPLKRVSRSRLAAPSSNLATSPRRSAEPSGLVRMTIFSKSLTESNRPLVWMFS
jgi:hypothetical protein